MISQIDKYVWLISKLRRRRLTFKEISDAWEREDFLGKHAEKLQQRTFHNHRSAIFDLFGIDIKCAKSCGYVYYIDNVDTDSDLRSWLLESYSMLNQIQADKSLHGRIIYEDVPSGSKWLTTITEAMREGRIIRISYKKFAGMDEKNVTLEPYCLKVFCRRWYLVARNPEASAKHGREVVLTYALDRIVALEVLEDKFVMRDDFSAEDYFDGCVGVFTSGADIEIVQIKVYDEKINYFRTLPLHSSQKEVEAGDGYEVFEYRLRPTYDFYQQVLMHGPEVEIISPEPVREHLKKLAVGLADRYA